jgi:ATP-dependent DNA helicase RecG
LKLILERLNKILELEQAKGCSDTAVIGGLDRFLSRYAAELSQICLPSPDYAALSREQREEWLEQTLKQLVPQGGEKEASPDLNAPISELKGISTSLATKFGKLGVKTIRDMLYFFPRRHIDYSQRKHISELEIDKEQTIVARVWEAATKSTTKGMALTEAIIGDETGNIRVVWFNQPYLTKRLRTNSRLAISGRVSLWNGHKVFQSPEYEFLESEESIHTGRLIPVYPLTEGLHPRQMRRLMKQTVDRYAPQLVDFLPQEVKQRAGLVSLSQAIAQAHYPDNEQSKNKARRRLAFDELFLIQLGALLRRKEWQERQGYIITDSGVLDSFLPSLPFELTSAQKRALGEILADLSQPRPMCRLLQGEVGSGKTVVATAAILLTAASGYQATLMAPTEILAEQHFDTICQLLGEQDGNGPLRSFPSQPPHPLTVGLLSGGLKGKDKQGIQQDISLGKVNVVIGTHALIQKGVEFDRLGLVVVDEQHRFGVMQRAALRGKGSSPHVLVMSATPIPRSLALTIYGDLDLSVIDELPPGRQEVKTRWLSPEEEQSAYEFVRQQVRAGRQAFIICPLIEESEAIETKAAITEYQRLSQQIFPDFRLGLLHGRMSTSEKDKVMQQFRSGEFHILVSTPVVEVGIDVPNATVMVVEGADRFGLAQLHQFRGRVRRSQHQSYCLLLAETPSVEAKKRLIAIERTQDGFDLAEEDLRLRGPGEFFGTRQSGFPDLKMAKLSDIELLEQAREESADLLESDPKLEREEHRLLAQEVARLWQGKGD